MSAELGILDRAGECGRDLCAAADQLLGSENDLLPAVVDDPRSLPGAAAKSIGCAYGDFGGYADDILDMVFQRPGLTRVLGRRECGARFDPDAHLVQSVAPVI